MQKHKIAYIHQYFNTPEMSGGTRSYEIARRLVKYGHEVHIITTNRYQDKNRYNKEIIDGINVHYINCKYNNRMNFNRRIFSFCKFAYFSIFKTYSIKPSFIYATSTPLTVCIPCLVLSFIYKLPYVFEVRDMWPDVPVALGAIKNK